MAVYFAGTGIRCSMWRTSYMFPYRHFHRRIFPRAFFRQTRLTLLCLLVHPFTCVATMAPHLTLVEQSRALQASAKGETPMAVFDTLEKARQRKVCGMAERRRRGRRRGGAAVWRCSGLAARRSGGLHRLFLECQGEPGEGRSERSSTG